MFMFSCLALIIVQSQKQSSNIWLDQLTLQL